MKSINKKQISLISLVVLCILILAYVGANYLPPGIDWRDTYRPAALTLLSGKSPFTVEIFFAAPWCFIPLVPFAILPENYGRAFIVYWVSFFWIYSL